MHLGWPFEAICNTNALIAEWRLLDISPHPSDCHLMLSRSSASSPRGGMRLLIVLATIWLCLGGQNSARATEAIQTGFVSKIFQDETGDHRYVVWVPPSYDPDLAWPVMLFLHGAGERGTDGLVQTRYGLGPMISRWGGFPWIVVFPQAEDTRSAIRNVWSPQEADGRRALAILEQVERDYRTDPKHRVLTGWSMGGRGCYLMAAAHPKKWTAVVPVSGWAEPEIVAGLRDVPIWAFHGEDDPLVPVGDHLAAIESLKNSGGAPLWTVLPEREHTIWRSVYASREVFQWMSQPTRGEVGATTSPTIQPIPEIEMSREETLGPFVPEINVENAVVVRLGPNIFENFSQIATEQISKTPFQGVMPGTSRATRAMGMPVQVATSPMWYRVPVTEVEVRPTPRQTFHLRATVANAHITVGRTDIQALLCQAVAGPMTVWLGHRYPLTIEAEVEPYIQDEKFRVKTHWVDASVPNDNWYVTQPSVRSLLMPSARVSQSLVEGVYGSKSTIEDSLESGIQEALDELSFALPEVSDDQLLTGLWPMPAYRPRAKPLLDHLTVNESGMSVVFGLVVAALDPWSKPEPRQIQTEISAEGLPDGDIAIQAAQGLIDLLSEQLISAGVAHINVSDVPRSRFSGLASREVLAQAIPAVADLPPGTEIRTELSLEKPLGLSESKLPRTDCEKGNCFTIFQLEVPELLVRVSVRDRPGEVWRDWAEIQYSVSQLVRLEVGLELDGGREVVSKAERPATIQARPRWVGKAPPNAEFDVAGANAMLLDCWLTWWDPEAPTAIKIPDLQFQKYARRLEGVVPGDNGMVAVFEKLETVITNRSEVALQYRVQDEDGAWSEARFLSPGENHAYRIASGLSYEGLSEGHRERYDIPAGRDVTFKRRSEGQLGLVLEALPEPLQEQKQIPGIRR